MALGIVRVKFCVRTLHGLTLTLWAAPRLLLAQQTVSPEIQSVTPTASAESADTLQEIVVIANAVRRISRTSRSP